MRPRHFSGPPQGMALAFGVLWLAWTSFSLPARGQDADGDEVPDFQDNCPTIFNPEQADADGDHIGDACDRDTFVLMSFSFNLTWDQALNGPRWLGPEAMTIRNAFTGEVIPASNAVLRVQHLLVSRPRRVYSELVGSEVIDYYTFGVTGILELRRRNPYAAPELVYLGDSSWCGRAFNTGGEIAYTTGACGALDPLNDAPAGDLFAFPSRMGATTTVSPPFVPQALTTYIHEVTPRPEWVMRGLAQVGVVIGARFSVGDWVRVPLQVNVLKGVTVSRDDIEAAVTEANRILDQASIRLLFHKGINVVTNVSDPDNNDGQISQAEKGPMRLASAQELNERFGPGRGYKLVFANLIADDPKVTGNSPHNPRLPVSIIKNEGTPPQWGQTFVHEFGHVFTLGAYHLIDDRGTPDPADDLRANKDGHHPTDRNNIMWRARNSRTGTVLTGNQADEIRGQSRTRSRSIHGAWTDDVGDAILPQIDLYLGTLYAPDATGDLQVSIDLAGLHPAGTAVDSRFELLLNTDNNPATGTTVGSFGGIDKILRIRLTGQFPFTQAAGTLTAELFDVASATATPLGPGSVERTYDITDMADESDPPVIADVLDEIRQTIPFSVLGTLADQVPAGVRATDLATTQTDEASFLWAVRGCPRPFDSDCGGASDELELAAGTDPNHPADDAALLLQDTDGDGVPNGRDAFPLDPQRSELRLVAQQRGAVLMLSWPADAGALLQGATSLLTPIHWQGVTNTPQLLGRTLSVTVPGVSGSQFYRLTQDIPTAP